MSALGVVVVTHNSQAAIGACLEALRGTGADVVVVDNASSDGTVETVRGLPSIRLIANPWNRGFAAAVNQGIQTLNAECILLLNPDAEVLNGIELLMEACADPAVAAAGGALLDSHGRPQTGFMVRRLPGAATLALETLGVNRLWPRNPVNRRYRCQDVALNEAADVEQPAGAFLALRRDVWRKLGGFDERFHPLWFDDVDYCKRALEAGYRIRFVPAAKARHQGGHSATQLPWKTRERYWCGNLLTYAAKHFRPVHLRAVCMAVVLGSLFRAVLGIIRGGSLEPVSIYWTVIRLAGRSLFSGRSEAVGLSSAFAGR